MTDSAATCEHANTVFDRTVCPEPCNTMHTICQDCGRLMEDCANAIDCGWFSLPGAW